MERTKESEAEGERPKARARGKHLRNSCGSESGKGERKPTVELSTGIWKEGTGNQVGEKEETEEARAEAGHRESSCKAEPGRKGKEDQKAD